MIPLEQAKNASENTQIEAIVSFDERGQLVIPKDLRKKYNLKPQDKFALISCKGGDGELCCFTMMDVKKLSSLIKEFLGPALKDIINP